MNVLSSAATLIRGTLPRVPFDNGIGSFSILDMARAFKANKLTPKRTVEFVMFMGEEQGLLGSRYMVDEAVKDGSIET